MTTGDRLHFIGTATTVMSLGSFTLLTDPNFLHRGQRAYLGWGLSTRRLTEPAIEPEALPALDAVLLSHLHGAADLGPARPDEGRRGAAGHRSRPCTRAACSAGCCRL